MVSVAFLLINVQFWINSGWVVYAVKNKGNFLSPHDNESSARGAFPNFSWDGDKAIEKKCLHCLTISFFYDFWAAMDSSQNSSCFCPFSVHLQKTKTYKFTWIQYIPKFSKQKIVQNFSLFLSLLIAVFVYFLFLKKQNRWDIKHFQNLLWKYAKCFQQNKSLFFVANSRNHLHLFIRVHTNRPVLAFAISFSIFSSIICKFSLFLIINSTYSCSSSSSSL